MKLVKRIEIEKPVEVYNLHIKDDHNYIVNGAVVANCHAAKADVLKNLLSGVLSRVPIRWGLTGTVPKEDFEYLSIKCTLGPVIGKLSASDLQEQGVLANCHVHVKQLQDYTEYNDYPSERKYLLGNQDRMEFLAEQIKAIAETGNTLVLIDLVGPGDYLTSLLPGAIFVRGKTKLQDRKEDFAEFATSNEKITVATYGVAAVGINIPRIFNLVLIEPGKSFTRVIQSIGRGIRKAEDKDFVDIYDFTSSCKFSKRHLTKRKQFYTAANYPYSVQKIEWK